MPPAGPEWLHEIKHYGFRLLVWRDGGRVRLFTRNGYEAACYPRSLRLQARLFLIDGDA